MDVTVEIGRLAQLVERSLHTGEATGSSPAPTTKTKERNA